MAQPLVSHRPGWLFQMRVTMRVSVRSRDHAFLRLQPSPAPATFDNVAGGGTASVNTRVADKAYTSHQEMRRLECEVERRNVIHGAGKGEKGTL